MEHFALDELDSTTMRSNWARKRIRTAVAIIKGQTVEVMKTKDEASPDAANNDQEHANRFGTLILLLRQALVMSR